MKLKLVFCFFIFSEIIMALPAIDTVRMYTPNGDLASISFSDNNGTLQYKKIYWQDLPNWKYAFVSKTGFVTVKDGLSVKLDSSTPDNIIETGIDEKYNVFTYIWKNGRREIYEGGEPDGTKETKYEGDKPGVYEWRNGKLKFIRKLNKEDLVEKERANKESEEVLKMMMNQIDTSKTK